jgi:hypothetical protein
MTCSKCGEATLVGQDFHSHILICGGLKPWDISPSKRKRRKGGHGGGLKSTVRMIQKSGQSRDNTDTGSFAHPLFFPYVASVIFGSVLDFMLACLILALHFYS